MFVPFPRKMTRGLIRGSPSANNVICTYTSFYQVLHCFLLLFSISAAVCESEGQRCLINIGNFASKAAAAFPFQGTALFSRVLHT